jgi:hypothetical protein
MKGIEKSLFPNYLVVDSKEKTVKVLGSDCYFALISFHEETHRLALAQLQKCLRILGFSHSVVHDCRCPPYHDQLREKFAEIQSTLFPASVSAAVDEKAWASLDESQEETLRSYYQTKLQLLQCSFLRQYAEGVFDGYDGKWINLVGERRWNQKAFNSRDEAEEEGCMDFGMGYPKVLFTACVGDDERNLHLLPDLDAGVEKGAIPFKNSPHSIPFFGNFQLLNGSSRLTPFVAFDHATRILCC